MSHKRRALLVLPLLATALVFGCSSVLHELQPHRMWKWNSGPGPSLNPEFSYIPRSHADEPAIDHAIDRTEGATIRAQNP